MLAIPSLLASNPTTKTLAMSRAIHKRRSAAKSKHRGASLSAKCPKGAPL